MRARGLKLMRHRHVRVIRRVAPHAGAWIETWPSSYCAVLTRVAPHAGAWIETPITVTNEGTDTESRPMRARGLKLMMDNTGDSARRVAPHAGAWIETG